MNLNSFASRVRFMLRAVATVNENSELGREKRDIKD